MGLGRADALPDFGVNDGEENVRILDLGVHMGDIEPVHLRQGGPVDRGAADDEAFVGTGLSRSGIGLLEAVDAGHLRNRVAAEVQDDVPAPGQRPADGKVGAPAHDHGIAPGHGLEVLQVFGYVPGKGVFHTDSPVVGDGDDDAFFHTATGALMAGQGSYPSRVKSSYRKSKTDLTSGLRIIRGSGRGSRVSWRATWSKWLR